MHRCVAILGTTRVPFQPGVDPFGLQTNGAPPTDARVVDFAALTRCVDRVPTHAGVLCSFGDVQPDPHGEILLGPIRNGGNDESSVAA
jgi:hypothetical protein